MRDTTKIMNVDGEAVAILPDWAVTKLNLDGETQVEFRESKEGIALLSNKGEAANSPLEEI